MQRWLGTVAGALGLFGVLSNPACMDLTTAHQPLSVETPEGEGAADPAEGESESAVPEEEGRELGEGEGEEEGLATGDGEAEGAAEGEGDGPGEGLRWNPAASVVTEDRANAVELLIVAPADFSSAFQPLVEWRRQLGVATSLITMEEVLQQAAGRDVAEALRRYLKQARAQGLRSVLLGGDTPHVPHRLVRTEVEVAGLYWEQSEFATDLYFAALDGDWDANRNGEYAELSDDPDLEPDLQVARAPLDSSAEVAAWVAKVILYEQGGAGDYQDRYLFLSEDTGYYGFSSSGALEDFADRIFPPEAVITKLYVDAGLHPGSRPVTSRSMLAELNRGYNQILHLGHGDTSSLYLLDEHEVRSLENSSRPSIYVTCACYGGAFQEDDAISELLLRQASGGAIAYIGNTDVGIGFPSGLAYLQALFLAQFGGARTLGQAVLEARRHFTNPVALRQSLHPDRWTQLVLSILGDPELLIWQEVPRSLQLSSSVALVDGRLRVVARALDDEVALPPRKVSMTLSGELGVLLTGEADPQGLIQFELSPPPPGTQLRLTAHGPRHAPVSKTLNH